jgi:hypothetical protein
MEEQQTDNIKPVEETGIRGFVELVLRGPDGEIKQVETLENIIVAGGLAHIASRMTGIAQAVMGWLGVGTGSTGVGSEVVGNTLLVTEIARVATTPTIVTTTQTNDTVQHVATIPAGTGTGAINEAGLFNVVTANTATMLNRITFAVINKAAGDALTVTWKIKIA